MTDRTPKGLGRTDVLERPCLGLIWKRILDGEFPHYPHMGGCQDYDGPFLDPYYKTAPNI